MKKLLFALTIAGASSLIACGPSAEDQAKAQAEQDSIDAAKQAAYDDSVAAAAEKAAAEAAAAAYAAGQAAGQATEAASETEEVEEKKEEGGKLDMTNKGGKEVKEGKLDMKASKKTGKKLNMTGK
jgi:hypothetical protein